MSNKKLWFLEDTAKMAQESVFPLVDRETAICFMQLFCHRLNELYEKEGIEAVIDIVWYGDAIKKSSWSYEHKTSYKPVKHLYKDPQDPTKGILTPIPSEEASSQPEVAKNDEGGVDESVGDSVDEVKSAESDQEAENGNP